MLILTDTTNPAHRYRVGSFATVREAQRDLWDAGYQIITFEEDADYPGHYDIAAAKNRADLRLFTLSVEG